MCCIICNWPIDVLAIDLYEEKWTEMSSIKKSIFSLLKNRVDGAWRQYSCKHKITRAERVGGTLIYARHTHARARGTCTMRVVPRIHVIEWSGCSKYG